MTGTEFPDGMKAKLVRRENTDDISVFLLGKEVGFGEPRLMKMSKRDAKALRDWLFDREELR